MIAMGSGADSYDVAVIGAGLAGSCLAGALARAGTRVALIDAQAERGAARRDFRAEKFGADQMALFEGLGFGRALAACTTATEEVAVVRYGRLAYRRPPANGARITPSWSGPPGTPCRMDC